MPDFALNCGWGNKKVVARVLNYDSDEWLHRGNPNVRFNQSTRAVKPSKKIACVCIHTRWTGVVAQTIVKKSSTGIEQKTFWLDRGSLRIKFGRTWRWALLTCKALISGTCLDIADITTVTVCGWYCTYSKPCLCSVCSTAKCCSRLSSSPASDSRHTTPAQL